MKELILILYYKINHFIFNNLVISFDPNLDFSLINIDPE